jgi:hypothetical protein
MATHTHLFGLVGILAAVACNNASSDDEEETSGSGGATATNTYFGSGGANSATTTTSTTTTATSFGGTTTTTTVTGSGGTTVTTTTTSTATPNRTLTPAQEATITASACNAWAIEPEAAGAAKLELVIDVSSSMGNRAPGTNNTKWEVTRDALVEAVPGLTSGGGLPANVSVGLMFYPNMRNETVSSTPTDPGVCINTAGETPMAMLGGNEAGTHRTLLRQRLTEAILGLGTPTADAYDYVLYNTVLSETQKAIDGDPYMLLITDGMPTLYKNCYNPAGQLRNLPGDEVVAAVDAAFNLGVKTFIVGSPGSEEGKDWLSMAAFMGGTAAGGCDPGNANGPYCHMDMTTAADFSVALKNGLAQVMSMITSCKFAIPLTSADGTQVVDLDQISPIIDYSNGQIVLIGKNTSTSTTTCTGDGYRILSNTQMELCTNTCTQVQSDPLAKVNFLFGCAAADVAPTDTTTPTP